jgi:hypothetical protein
MILEDKPQEPTEVSRMTARECRDELSDADHDLNTLRALVAVARHLTEMRRRSRTGTVQVYVQAGLARNVERPEQIPIAS